jgi:hypothetical protein
LIAADKSDTAAAKWIPTMRGAFGRLNRAGRSRTLKAEERRGQRERPEDERRRESDRASTAAQLADTEQWLAAAIATIRQPKAEQLAGITGG